MITMSKCSIVHYLFACSADTGIFRYSGTGWLDLESSSVNPRGLPSNSIGMHLKVLHIVCGLLIELTFDWQNLASS